MHVIILLRSWLERVFPRHLEPASAKFEVRLPSEIPQAYFQAVVESTWAPGTNAGERMRSLADLVHDVAQRAAKKCSVLDRDMAWAVIERSLLNESGMWGSDLAALRVADLSVGPDDRSLADSQQKLRREAALTQAKAANLGVLLGDPTTARLWWLENSPGKLEKLVEQRMDDVFEKVSALFGESVGRQTVDPIAELVRLFLLGLDARSRERLIEQLQLVFRAYEREDLAVRLDSYPL